MTDPSRARVGTPATPLPRPATLRNPALDWARLAAAAGIVVFHAGAPGAGPGHAGLPFFLALLALHAWQPAGPRQPIRLVAAARARRLLLPWLGWSAVYGLALAGQSALDSASPLAFVQPWMLLTGPSLHLWFLPFALAVSLALTALSARLHPSGMLAAGCVLAALGAAAAITHVPVRPPLVQWAEAVPPLLLGVALAAAPRHRAATLALFAGGAGLLGWPGNSAACLGAAGLLVLCLAWPPVSPHPGASRAGKRAADLSLTIYLAHPAVAAALLRLTPGAERTLALALATFALSACLAAALHLARARWQGRR